MGRHDRYYEEESLSDRNDIALMKRLLPYAAPHRVLFGLSMLLVVMITLVDLSLPYVTKITIDTYIVPPPDTTAKDRSGGGARPYRVNLGDPRSDAVVQKYPDRFTVEEDTAAIPYTELKTILSDDLAQLRHRDLSGISMIALCLVGLVCLHFGLTFAQALLMEYTGQMVMHQLRSKLFAHTLRLSVEFFSRNPVGRLTTRVTNDIQNMHELFTSVVSFVFKDLFLLVGIVIVLLTISVRLALVSFMVLPLVFLAAIYFARVARGAFRELRIKIAEINTLFSETIQGIRIVQLFSYQTQNLKRFAAVNHDYYLAGMKQVRVFAVFMPAIELMGTLAVALVIYYGGYSVLEGGISLGAMVAFISYLRMFFRPIRDIAEKFNILQNAMASAERIFLILDRPTADAVLPAGNEPRLNRIDTLAFETVSFAYHHNEPVLKQVSFSLKKGETLAVIGPTGAGKTTLINLIVRFYNPTSGTVLINGRSVDAYPVGKLRQKIALVTQDPFLFSGTVWENIFPSHTKNEQPKWETIIRSAHCQELVDRQPNGIDTILSEGGASLSSGERQLISIARAFAKNPDLIILDEATSYIDTNAEQQIQKALSNLIQHRSAIIIAHRLSTARAANRIITLHQGRIVESGSHQELMAQKGFYYRLNQMEK
jgi:ATP-binding cassette subfamily B multidrug efflux pump